MFAGRLLSSLSVAKIHHQTRKLSLQSTVPLDSGKGMPIVGLGTFLMEADEAIVERTLATAIDLGYRHIDSAFCNPSEKFIGKALQKFFKSGKIKRDDLFITTKLPMNGMQPEWVEYFLKKSLESLKLDFVDLYLLQSPIPTMKTANDDEIVPLGPDGRVLVIDVELRDTWNAMESLVDKMLTNHIGLSNVNSQQFDEIWDNNSRPPANLQVECHAYLPQYDLQWWISNCSLPFTAYAPLGSPAFPEFARNIMGLKDYEKPKLLDDEKLKPIALKYKKTPAQILLRYLVERGIVVIPKSTNPERLKENIEIFDFSLEDEDVEVLKSMSNGTRYFGLDYVKEFKEHWNFPFKDGIFGN